MARITVEDCLEQVPNRFTLVLVAAERAKQLIKGSGALIEDLRGNKEIVTSLREIAAGVVAPDFSEYDENELMRGLPEAMPVSAQTSEDLPPEVDEDLPPEAD